MPGQEACFSDDNLFRYVEYLRQEERSRNTILKYLRDIKLFLTASAGQEPGKATVLRWKEQLVESYAPASVNSMLAAVNSFLDWADKPQWKVKPVKIQRQMFSKPEKELNQEEYMRLVKAAEREGNERLSLLLQTICATGIRVSEVCYITAESVKAGRAEVDCKGKKRSVFLPLALRRILQSYSMKTGIQKGSIFLTKGGKPLNRSNIWRDMKKLCESAGVEPEKVFPHNLRHLFARTFYSLERDLSRLADLLGHTNITTTRIYTMESGSEHAKQLERMGLVLTRREDTT